MPSEQFEHIQRIRNDLHQASERVRDSLNNSVRILAKDLYNKHTHFIFELIQNAEDNSYCGALPSLSFQLTKSDLMGSEGADGALIIQNNETGFCPENVDALCAVGKTTKQKAQGYIGEKGIGFKSVFRVTENPHIFSNGYHFCLPERDEETGLGYIVPQWIDVPPASLNLTQTHIILPLTKAAFGYDKIEEMLLEIEPETVLFLSKLQEIRIQTDTGTDLIILKNADELPKMEVLVEGRRQGSSFSTVDEFLVCTQTFHKPVEIHHEKREGINERDVSIAFPMDENATGIRKIFAYLPVSETDFPFLINADFILTSSREGLQQDEPWNRWLIDCVADLVTSKLFPLLKVEQLLTVPFLETLANSLSVLDEDERHLFYPIFRKVSETFSTQEFLPAADGTFVSAENAKLARGDAVRNLLSHAQLGALFPGDEREIRWLSADITSDRAPTLRRYLMDLGIEEVTPATFARRLSPLFLASQSDDWFIEFYRFLSGQSAVERTLRTEPILRLQDGSHVKPCQEDGSPNAYLPIGTDTDTSLPIVKLEIVQNEDALGFLKKLGIPEWDIVEEVIRDILPKYEVEPPKMPLDAYRRDFAKIEQAYKTDSTEQKKRLRQALFNTAFILVEKPPAGDSNYLKPPQLSFASDNRLWGNFRGNYSRVSVRKEIFEFLKVLDIPEWNVVDEVLKTILPKYDADSPTVPLQEHRADFAKFADAYTTGSYFQKTRLRDKLKVTPFILTQCHDADKLVYRKPDELYFPTEELRLYFEGNASGRFVSSEYAEIHHNMLKELGTRDSILVVCQSSPGLIDDITLDKPSYYHRRGLKGFDPDIEVVGLANALKNPSRAKSEIIWNRVAVPYRHCIRGTVITSSRQDFSRSASFYREEETVSQHLGRLLIEKAWLPDADGNLRKPNELTLENLPESFERDKRLADLLGMKKDKVAELAAVTGVPEDAIRDLMVNPDEYAEFKEWKAAKQAEQTPPIQEHPGAETTHPHRIDYPDEVKKSFNRAGETELRPSAMDEDTVTHPERRRQRVSEEHRARLEDEPSADERRKKTRLTILEGPDPQVREYLAEMYDGKCQICSGTFPERNGQPFFIANNIVERRVAQAVDTSANALCLCADHFARWQHGAVEADAILSQIENFRTESEGGESEPVLEIKMCGEECEIRFKEKHLLDLQELLKASKYEV